MSKYDKYRISQPQVSSPSDKYAKYKVMPTSQEEGDSWPAFLGKSAFKEATSIADLPQALAEFAGNTNRNYGSYGIPAQELIGSDQEYIPTPDVSFTPITERFRKGVKNYAGVDLEPRPKTGGQRIASHAIEFAGSLGPWGFLGKGAGLLNKGKKAAKLAGTGAGIGASSGVLQEGGVNPLAADIGASVFAPAASPKNLLNVFKNAGQTAAKIPMRIMGLSPKGLNIEAARAGRDLGIDLPAAALTDSTLTGFADQWVNKTPFFGNTIKKKYATAEEQTLKALEDVYNKTGPSKTPEVTAQIANLYDTAATTLPKEAKVKPIHLKKAIDDIKIDTAILSPDEKNLLQSLETIKGEIEPQSKLVSQFGKIKMPVQEFDVNKLIGTKKSLNSIIKWDMDEGVKNQLRKVQKAISEDISEYGKTNPEWYKTFKEADSLFSKTAKREKLESLLSDKSINPATDNLSYNALSKTINSPDKADLIKKQVDPETFAKIQKLGTVAKAMAIKNKNIPNPSGTAMTGATLGLIYGLFTNPVPTTGAIVGARSATYLLTDKKFLDLALKLAENPNKPNMLTATALNKRVKEITGYSTVALNNALNNKKDKEE